MKRLSKLILIFGAAVFLFAACSNSSGGGSGSSGSDPKPAAPADNGDDGVESLIDGGFITVKPASDGLHIKVDYSKRNDTQYWRHISFAVQDISDPDLWVAAIETGWLDIKLDGTNLKPTEYVFPFTKKGCKYKVWVTHCGVDGDDWGGWKSEEEEDAYKNQTGITATGGLGNVNVTSNYDGFLFLTPDPMLYLDRLILNLPDCLKDVSAEWDVHAEVDNTSNWAGNPDKQRDERFPFTGSFIKGINKFDDSVFHFSGSSKIFFNVNYCFEYKNMGYKQWVVNNDNRYFSDFNSASGAEHFPLIKIKSTANENDMSFVLSPVANHVKEYLWGGDVISEPWYEACDIYNGDTKIGSGEVKVRGNWTTAYGKKSLRIKFDEKQNILGLNGDAEFKNWVLLADWKDASLLRNATAFKLYHELFPYGYVSDCKLVEVEVNGENLGVYLLAEQQEAKRLGLTEPAKKATNTNIGYLIEMDSYYENEKDNEKFEIDYLGDLTDYAGTTVDKNKITKGYTIKSDINDKAQHDFIADYMNKLWEICYKAVYKNKYYRFKEDYTLEEYTPEGSSDDDKCKNCIEQRIDLGSLADMYIFCELTCDPDLSYSSFFMNVDFGEGKDGKLYFKAPWDFDSTMGNKRFCITGSDCSTDGGINGMYAGLCQPDVNGNPGSPKEFVNPWMVIFIKQSWFQNIVKDRWNQAKQRNPNVLSNIQTFIDDHSKDTQQPVYDFTRALWGNPGDNGELCEDSQAAAKQSQKASAQYFKGWITARWYAVNSIISGLDTN